MYDVVMMKNDLEEAVGVVSRRIQDGFLSAFKHIYPDDQVSTDCSALNGMVESIQVSQRADISAVSRRSGFYIILTDYPVDENSCQLAAGGLRAVYRGECSEVRLRIMSHLANSAYRLHLEQLANRYLQDPKNAGKVFYKDIWPHCMKLEKGGRSGIDVEVPPYSDHQWLVLVHSMVGSSQGVRKIAEAAFDEAFGHPAASRDGG